MLRQLLSLYDHYEPIEKPASHNAERSQGYEEEQHVLVFEHEEHGVVVAIDDLQGAGDISPQIHVQEVGTYPDKEKIRKKRRTIGYRRQFPAEKGKAKTGDKKDDDDQPEVHLEIKAQDRQKTGLYQIQPSVRFLQEGEKIEEEKEKKPELLGLIQAGHHAQESKNGDAKAEMF